jgi:hypothetical protein
MGGTKIINAKCNILDPEGINGTSKRCFLQIQTIQVQPPKSSSDGVVEIIGEEFGDISKPNNGANNKKT